VLALRIIVRDAHTGRFGTLDIPLRACTASE
jgi:hypothetical protein